MGEFAPERHRDRESCRILGNVTCPLPIRPDLGSRMIFSEDDAEKDRFLIGENRCNAADARNRDITHKPDRGVSVRGKTHEGSGF